MSCVLLSSTLIYFAYCFVCLKPYALCHELDQPRWEECFVIRLQVRHRYLLLVACIFRDNSKLWADNDPFQFSLAITDADSDFFALIKVRLKYITVHFFLHADHKTIGIAAQVAN